MLGQKKNRDDSLNTTTAPDCFTLYPTLYPFLLKTIGFASCEGATPEASIPSDGLKLHPCLFPVLSILARLAPGIATEETEKCVGVSIVIGLNNEGH